MNNNNNEVDRENFEKEDQFVDKITEVVFKTLDFNKHGQISSNEFYCIICEICLQKKLPIPDDNEIQHIYNAYCSNKFGKGMDESELKYFFKTVRRHGHF